MVRKRRKKKKFKTATKLLIICEGDTDAQMIKGMIRNSSIDSHNIDYEILEGKGYFSFDEIFSKNKGLYKIVFYVTDLDRACKLEAEKKRLKANIRLLFKENKFNNVFLSYPEIEVYIAAGINLSVAKNGRKEDIAGELEALGYKKGAGAFKFFNNNNGSNKNAEDILDNGFYINKRNEKIPAYNDECINKNQSNLINFIDYLSYVLLDWYGGHGPVYGRTFV